MFWEMSFFDKWLQERQILMQGYWQRVDKIHIFDPTIQERQAH